MNFFAKVSAAVVVVGGGVLVAQHAGRAISATLPQDMPKDSQFMASGFNIANAEAEGDWVACRVDPEQSTDWCRVTDQKGSVVYQGDFLPVYGRYALPAGELKVAERAPDRMWIQGPAEAAPVPVIPLTDGKLLVPAGDRDALEQRWSSDPSELNRVNGQ